MRKYSLFKNLPHIAVALLFVIAPLCRAQWIGDAEIEEHIHKGIDDIYNISFDSARAEFRQVIKLKPEHPAGHFFLATVEWWNILIDINNTSRDDKFFSMLDKVIDLCDKRLDEDDHDVAALFFKGGALGFQGRLHGNREDWVKAANAGRQALPIVQDAHKLAPDNFDILLGIGIYNYYADIVPEKYPFVKPFMIFFPKGDKKKGIEQLRKASERATYANVEATYFLLQLFQNYEGRSPEALALALNLHNRYPRNPVFHKYVGRCYTATGQWSDAESTFLEILQRVKEHRTGYGDLMEREAQYYLGIAAFNDRRYDDALKYLYRCDELSRVLERDEQTGFMVLTNLRIGMIYDLQSKRQLAIEQYNKVLKLDDFQDSHDQAKRYLKTPFGKS